MMSEQFGMALVEENMEGTLWGLNFRSKVRARISSATLSMLFVMQHMIAYKV